MIDSLSDESKTEEELEEIETEIQTQLNNLLPKVENRANKAELAKLKNQLANLQAVMLDKAVKNLAEKNPKMRGKGKLEMLYLTGRAKDQACKSHHN